MDVGSLRDRLVPLAGVVLSVGFAGCGLLHQAAPTPTPTIILPTPVSARETPTPGSPRHKHIPLAADYKAFVQTICGAIAAKNSSTVLQKKMYYQGNQGVYYSTFNKMHGVVGPPSIVSQWLAAGSERCVRYGPSQQGHGLLITRGWTMDGGWSILDLDKINGSWEINDFTFGTQGQVKNSFFTNATESFVY